MTYWIVASLDICSCKHLKNSQSHNTSNSPYLSTKEQVPQLSKCKEDDEEHDSKASHILGTLLKKNNV